ncbi:uncharacterized protein LOC126822478 isoform X2 [Patella vulgata]|uniref:uncharacterized protein LOC126822478 isoform X2 n=1 Tax=Patella vulgata TaxID=6465 RepID=UPI0021806DFC|nr:uncharacterized protein LOC126822478 isoform X2 [Patella vulgata]
MFTKRKTVMCVVCVACFMFGLNMYSRQAENLDTKQKGQSALEDKRHESKIFSRDSTVKISRNEILNAKTILKNDSVKQHVKRPVNKQKHRFKQNEQLTQDLFIFRMEDHRNISGVNRPCSARHQELWRTCMHIRNNKEKCDGETCLCYNGGWWFEKPRFTNFSRLSNDILDQERNLLFDPPIDDVKKLPNPRKSKLQLVAPNAKNIYSLGDVINVRVDLYNSFGDVMTRGGDDVRAWMVGGQEGNKRVSGEVNDLKNGSYEVSFQTWWGGQNKIHVALSHERELLATHFRWRRQFFSLFLHRAVHKYQNKTIYTICGEYPELPNQNSICDFTKANGGLPWFCGRPNIPELQCGDLEHVEMFDAINIPITEPEFQVSTRHPRKECIADLFYDSTGNDVEYIENDVTHRLLQR